MTDSNRIIIDRSQGLGRHNAEVFLTESARVNSSVCPAANVDATECKQIPRLKPTIFRHRFARAVIDTTSAQIKRINTLAPATHGNMMIRAVGGCFIKFYAAAKHWLRNNLHQKDQKDVHFHLIFEGHEEVAQN